MSTIKLSAPSPASPQERRGFWEISVLFEDDDLLVLDKPAGLSVSPNRQDSQQPGLTQLLHTAIAAGQSWARERRLNYLMNAHQVDSEASGVLLFARSKPVLLALTNAFGAQKPLLKYVALVHGAARENTFAVDAKLAPHPLKPGLMGVAKSGKKSKTYFTVLEKFSGYTLLKCEPLTHRPHQVRVHLEHAGLPIVGDRLYGGKKLWLSRLKRDYRLKPGRKERPFIARPALHVEALTLPHPVTGQTTTVTAPWPKDLRVAVKYLRQFGKRGGGVME